MLWYIHALNNGYFGFELEGDMGVSENCGKQSIPMMNIGNLNFFGVGLF